MRREFYNLKNTLKISHLVVNGCSYTYGQGIVNPIQDAWASIVARELGVPLINLSLPGQGNVPIQRRTLEYFFKDLYNNNNPFYIHAYSQSARQEIYVCEDGLNNIVQDYILLDSSDESDKVTNQEKEVLIHSDDYKYRLLEKQKWEIWASINGVLDSYNVNHLATNYMPQTDGLIRDWFEKNGFILKTEVDTHPNRLRDFNMITMDEPKTPCLHETEIGHQIIADYTLSEIYRRYEKIEVVDLPHAKLGDILIHSPNSQKLKDGHIEDNAKLETQVVDYPAPWSRNVYFLEEMGLDPINNPFFKLKTHTGNKP